MNIKFVVLAIAVAFSASAFCLSSCWKEVSALSFGQEQNVMESVDSVSAVVDDRVEEPEEIADGAELQCEDSEAEAVEDEEGEEDECEAAEDADEEAEADAAAEEAEEEEEVGCDHTLVHFEYVAATCSAEGNLEYWVCSVCGGYFLDGSAEEAAEYEQLVISVNHTLETIDVREASCESGVIVEQCTTCEDTYFTYLEPTGEHVYGEWKIVTDATCENKGIREQECEICGYAQEEEIEQLDHEYVPIIEKAPTCTESGVTYSECVNCNDIGDYEYPRALGHDYVTREANAATCTENGWEEYEFCTRCEYIPSYTVTEATGHSYMDNVVEPTADACGYTVHTCQVCKDYYIDSYTEYTQELSYTLIYEQTSDGEGYIVAGLEEGSECTELVIPDYYNGLPVTEIAANAFTDNKSIISVTIGENVITIGDSAFSGCTYITEIYYNAASASVAALGVFNNAGRNSSGITLYIGSSVVSIPNNLFAGKFYYGTAITSANIVEIVFAEDSSLEVIGTCAFAGCNGLQSVYIPSTCTEIARLAFAYCTSLVYAKVPKNTDCTEANVFYEVASGFYCERY